MEEYTGDIIRIDDLETIASQLYDEMHGSVTEIRIE